MKSEFILNIDQSLFTTASDIQIPFQPLQCDADDIAMMQSRTKCSAAHFEPQIVQTVHIFRPEPWWMGAKVYEKRRLAPGNYFE